MANRGIRISELTTLASASMNTTIVGVASGITYKVELDTLATTIGSLLNTTDVNRLNNLESTSASVNTTNTAQNTRLTTIESVTGSYETKGRSIVSGSSQITYTSISSIPAGIVSGSTQITYENISSIPAGIVSGSSQLSGTTITNLTITNLTTVNQTASVLFSSGSNKFGDFSDDIHDFTGSVKISGSITTIGVSTATSFNGAINANNGVVSGSSQVTPLLPTGTVSGSSQILGGTQIISGAIYTHLVQYITIGGDLDFNI